MARRTTVMRRATSQRNTRNWAFPFWHERDIVTLSVCLEPRPPLLKIHEHFAVAILEQINGHTDLYRAFWKEHNIKAKESRFWIAVFANKIVMRRKTREQGPGGFIYLLAQHRYQGCRTCTSCRGPIPSRTPSK